MIVILSNINKIPQVYKGDILITTLKSENNNESYFWSDIVIANLLNAKRQGLKYSYDKQSGGLEVLNNWPVDEERGYHQITIEEYCKEKNYAL